MKPSERNTKQLPLRTRYGQSLIWLALSILTMALVLPAHAQLDTGSMNGVVKDPAGAVVPHASIEAKQVSTGTTYNTTSSAVGYYVFPALRTGVYTITVSAKGFKTAVLTGIDIAVGTQTTQDVSLAIGSSVETVRVRAGGLRLQTSTSEVDDTISPQEVEQLPLQVTGNLRAISSLEFLVPGAVGPGTSSGGSGFQMTKINGGQEEGTDYLVDGITTNRMQNGSGSFDIVSPSVEAVNEFHISISGMPAEYGRTTGGLANFNTKSGTNRYHGAIFDFYKNAALDGNNWFNNGYLAQTPESDVSARNNLQRPPDTKNDYGISLGGPFVIPHVYNGHNKTFFFFAWEQLRYNTGSAVTSLIPTPAELGSNGQYFDFSSTLGSQIFIDDNNGNPTIPATDQCNTKLYYGEIFDPATGGTVNGQYCRTPYEVNGHMNEIPIQYESTVAKNVLKYMPKPNLTGAGTNNYVYKQSDTILQGVYSLRIDQNLGPNNKIFGFYSARENTDQGNGSNLPPPLTSAGGGTVDQLGKMFRLGWDWVVTPNVVNVLTFGTNRSNNNNKSAAANMGVDWDSHLGIANGEGPVFPGFEFISSPYPSFGENDYARDVNNTIALNDIVHWQHGNHSFSFGGDFQYHQYSFISKIGGTCSGTSGCFSFWPNQTASDTTYWGRDGNSFAAFLIGQAGTANALRQLHSPRWTKHYVALFAQDNWRISHNLTANLGLRWSFDTPRREAEGDTSIMSMTAPNPAANGIPGALVFAGKGAGRNGNVGETWAKTYYRDFSPRVGFAYSPTKRDVIRVSSGLYYGPLVYADFGQGTMQGFTVNQTLFTSNPMLGPLVDNGLPVLPTTPDLNPSQSNTQAVDNIQPTFGKPAKVLTWSAQNQFQITPNTYLAVGYLGMHSTRLHGLIDFPNDIPEKYLSWGFCLAQWNKYPIPGCPQAPVPYANFYNEWGPTVWTEQALRPFPQYGYINQDSYLQNVGQSSYEAMTVKLQRRFSHGLSILASYTLSRTMTDADAIQPFYSTLQNQGGTQNPYDHKAEKAVSNEDIPNNLVISYLYDLPIGHGRKFLAHTPKVVNAVISNWRISGIQRYMSGQPISFWGMPGIPGFDNGIRPNRVAGQAVRRSGHFNPFDFVNSGGTALDHNSGACQTGYWNCGFVANPNPNPAPLVPYKFGDMPRNSGSIRGFPFYNEDFGISKTFPIAPGIKAEFRGEMFNAFNRHIFNKPDSGVQDTNFGRVTSTLNGPRNVQFVLRITY